MAIQFPVYITGVRVGDVLVASPTGTQNKGSILRVTRGYYPPNRSALDGLSSEEWDDLMKCLVEYEKYNNKTKEEIQELHTSAATEERDAYLSDEEYGLWVRVERLDGELFKDKLTPEQITTFEQPNPDSADYGGDWKLTDIYKAIPTKKPGTRARRHTLVFRPRNWCIKAKEVIATKKRLTFYDLYSGTLITGNWDDDGPIAIVEPVPELGIAVVTQEEGVAMTRDMFDDIIWELIPIARRDDIATAREWMTPFTPSVYKSLIQKIIRTGARWITYDDQRVPGNVCLLVAISELMMHPGVFVPNLQTFERGLVSATKRLAVSIFEDSYVPDAGIPNASGTSKVMSSLLVAAVLARDKTWIPPRGVIVRWFLLALTAHSDSRMFDYDTHSTAPIDDGILDSYHLAYAALRVLGSFETDINMVSWIAHNKGRPGKTKPSVDMFEEMPLVHAIDHHNHTDLAYWMPPQTITSHGTFGAFFREVWLTSSGVNPRSLKHNNTFQTSEFMMTLRKAQHLLYRRMRNNATVRPIIGELGTVTIEDKLDDAWLVGLVGHQEVRVGKRLLLVSLDPTDPMHARKVMLRPNSRSTNTTPITEEEIDAATVLFNKSLSVGITTIKQHLLPDLNRTTIRSNDAGTFEFVLANGSIKSWEEIKARRCAIGIHSALPPSDYEETATNATGDGVEEDALRKLDGIIGEVSQGARDRLVYYFRGARSRIEMNGIARDGSGVGFSTSIHDVEVFHVLLRVCAVCPAFIRLRGTRSFDILNYSFVSLLRKKLTASVVATASGGVGWQQISDTLNRPLLRHQRETLATIAPSPSRIHLISQPVGLGKTKEVCEVIKYRIEAGEMPEYVIWTLPESAVDSVVRELLAYSLPVRRVNPTKRKTAAKVNPFEVSIITHDHLRLMDAMLRGIAPNSFLVVDEFHLTLNQTLRTSIALELSRLSKECIAMSGTVIKDHHIELLVPWLEQTVPFEVTDHNIWAAMSVMISHRVPLDITVNYKPIKASLTEEQEEEYASITSNAINRRLTQQSFRRIVGMCYDACTDAIIRIVIDYLDKGKSIFVVTKGVVHQTAVRDMMLAKGVEPQMIHVITKDHPITLDHTTQSPIRVVIATIKQCTGYTLTKMTVMVTSVYFSSQATRTQLEGRIHRLSQRAKEIDIITVHTGILTNVMERYDTARSIHQAWMAAAKDVGLDEIDSRGLLSSLSSL